MHTHYRPTRTNTAQLSPVSAGSTLVRPIVRVPVVDVDSQRARVGTGLLAEWTAIMVHCDRHTVSCGWTNDNRMLAEDSWLTDSYFPLQSFHAINRTRTENQTQNNYNRTQIQINRFNTSKLTSMTINMYCCTKTITGAIFGSKLLTQMSRLRKNYRVMINNNTIFQTHWMPLYYYWSANQQYQTTEMTSVIMDKFVTNANYYKNSGELNLKVHPCF